ncbi:MAG: helix-turn-helix transcriptional regulator [Solirubrobacterales bacterium]|nr:helix-turn-helix transcriptional regulator [Solirubrobacterales bacterium]
MTTKRTYGDMCGIARALDVVGERWALLIVRELVLGPKRFTDLRGGMPGLSSEVLTQRLRELAQAGVLTRVTLPPPNSARVYELTASGRRLEPVLLALGRWGSVAPPPSADAELGVDALVLALPTLFDARAAGALNTTVELRLNEQPFRASVADGHLDVERGSAERPDAVITADPASLAAVLWHGGRAGALQVAGNRRSVARFLRLFPLPTEG